MDYGMIIAIVLVATSLVWAIFIRPNVKGNLTFEQLELIDFACEKAVSYAEQTYKEFPDIDRSQLALDYAFQIIEKAAIIPENYLGIIKGMIKANIIKLPKTHDENGNIII